MSDLEENITVDQNAENRLWKVLDSISERLSNIEDKLANVIRLEEKVSNHDETLNRFGNKLDDHETRIQQTELWKANHRDQLVLENLNSKVTSMEEELEQLANSNSIDRGRKDVVKEILKWVSTVFGGIILWLLTNGEK